MGAMQAWLDRLHEKVGTFPGASAGVLFLMTITLLFGPKVLSVIHLFSRPREIAAFGGPVRVLSGVILETLFSVLTAPVLIWFHTRFVLRNLEGKTVSWNTQTRDGKAGPRWLDIVREYWPLPLVGVGLAALAWSISPNYLAWVSPLLIGLLLAIPVAKVSGGHILVPPAVPNPGGASAAEGTIREVRVKSSAMGINLFTPCSILSTMPCTFRFSANGRRVHPQSITTAYRSRRNFSKRVLAL